MKSSSLIGKCSSLTISGEQEELQKIFSRLFNVITIYEDYLSSQSPRASNAIPVTPSTRNLSAESDTIPRASDNYKALNNEPQVENIIEQNYSPRISQFMDSRSHPSKSMQADSLLMAPMPVSEDPTSKDFEVFAEADQGPAISLLPSLPKKVLVGDTSESVEDNKMQEFVSCSDFL